jgi:ClpP class serine protease
MMTARRGIEAGLVDVIGDFKDALEAAAEAGGCRPTPRFIRPGRSLGQRIFSRTGIGQHSGGQALLEGLGRMMAGGIYYLEPGHIAGGDFSSWETS